MSFVVVAADVMVVSAAVLAVVDVAVVLILVVDLLVFVSIIVLIFVIAVVLVVAAVTVVVQNCFNGGSILRRYKRFLDFASMLKMAQALLFQIFNQRRVISACARLHQSN